MADSILHAQQMQNHQADTTGLDEVGRRAECLGMAVAHARSTGECDVVRLAAKFYAFVSRGPKEP